MEPIVIGRRYSEEIEYTPQLFKIDGCGVDFLSGTHG